MFDDIACKYDFSQPLFKCRYGYWLEKKAIAQLTELKPKTLLDVATGTADMAIMASRLIKPVKITGIDISAGMLEFGRKK